MEWKGIANSVLDAAKKHSPEILIGVGIAGMITTTVLAVRATPKAIKLMEEEKKRKKVNKLKPMQVVKVTWKCYIPAVATGALSVTCIIGANSIHLRRNAVLATAYSLSESALKTYQAKVIETIGENKEKKIHDEIAKDYIRNHPPRDQEIIVTGNGMTRCYDPHSDRYFWGDIDKIRKLEIQLNKELLTCMYISLSDYYDGIGLNHTRDSDDLGWNIDQCPIEFHYSSVLDANDYPCLVVDFYVSPRSDYRNLH